MQPRVLPPGRQGPGTMTPAIVARLEHTLRRRTGGILAGDHRAPGAGDGMELAQLRAYEAGDDVRRLDPAASARTGVPHVRLQVPERAVTTWIVLDASASMAFGTQGRLKSDVAEGVSEVVGRLGVRQGGRVALVLAGGSKPVILPPRPGRSALAAVTALVRQGVAPDASAPTARRGRRRTGGSGGNDPGAGSPAGARAQGSGLSRPGAGSRAGGSLESVPPSGTDGVEPPAGTLVVGLERLARVARGTGVVVVVSDFRDDGWAAPLRAAAARHTVVAIEVVDPAEAELPAAGLLTLVDPETGRLVEADTGSGALRRAYTEAEADRREHVRSGIRAAGADHIVLSTERDWLRDLGRRMA